MTDGRGEEGKQTQGEKETKGEKWTKGKREEGNRPAKGERRREAKGQEPAGMEKDREKAEEEGDELHSDAPQGRQSPRPVPRRHIWLEEPALLTPPPLHTRPSWAQKHVCAHLCPRLHLGESCKHVCPETPILCVSICLHPPP